MEDTSKPNNDALDDDARPATVDQSVEADDPLGVKKSAFNAGAQTAKQCEELALKILMGFN